MNHTSAQQAIETQKIFRGVNYNVVCRLTIEDMRREGLHRAAINFERRGIGAVLTLVRPKGRKQHDGYETLKGELLSVE